MRPEAGPPNPPGRPTPLSPPNPPNSPQPAGLVHPPRQPRPPALSRRLLEWSADRLETPELAADAAELYVERARGLGERAARWWYRRQALSSLVRLMVVGWDAAWRGGRPAWLAGFSLNARLGARMLVKYPGVTTVGVLAMAIGVGLGAAYLEVVNDFLHPTLPLPEGGRIVGLQNWDQSANEPELRSMRDFVEWRAELESVQQVGAFRSIERNLGIGDRPGEPASGAEISPSAFAMTRVPALLGRTLIDADERPGEAIVVVLGHEIWRSRFSGDRGIIGQTVRLGGTAGTVVGVMPDGFAFPVSHEFWTPLRPAAVTYERREGPPIRMFGRLAPGVTLAEAQAELTSLGLRAAADHPSTHERLRPRVVKYTELFVGGEGTGQAYLVVFVFVLLLLILSSNVATMVFARTATRENEIAMRSALGASRGQILAQFFVEALVLALVATVAGLAVVAWGTQWVTRFVWNVTEGAVPFWLDSGLNVTTIVYAIGLAVLGAVVAGVLPALKVTGSRLQARLRHPAAVGDSSLRFGGLWSGVIVVQVMFAVMVLPPAIVAVSSLAEGDSVEPGFPATEYLSARVEMERERPPADSAEQAEFFAEFRSTYDELRRRLLSDPAVSRVTLASRLPGMDHPQPWIEVDTAVDAAGASASRWVMATAVDADFFDAFDADIVAGRGFNTADLTSGSRAVMVNEHFVTDVLRERNAIGRRVRYTSSFGEREATGRPQGAGSSMREAGEWYEIVGVVRDPGMDTGKDAFFSGRGPGVYHPLTRAAMGAAGAYSVRLAFHVRGDAASFAPRLRDVAHAVHPALRLYDVLPLDGPVDRANQAQRLVSRFFASVTALVALIALLISVAGTYSVMSFTVARQTREIGIRIALGADRRRIIMGVFSRAMMQIGIGIIAGAVIWFYVIVEVLGGGDRIGLLIVAAGVLALVGTIACGVPVRRALRIEPADALREGA